MAARIVLCCWILAVAERSAQAELIKGVSYGPIPLKSDVGASEVPADDWFCDEAVSMWGKAGRGDLAVMRQLGANMVRLYGNNPNNDHANFLDEALAEGLGVSPGLSDYPYFQQELGSCLDTDFDCFSQVKPLYLQNLRGGFLDRTNSYHAALTYMNIINEPDLKMPWNADVAGVQEVYQMCRAIISAFDGMLEAEKQAGVSGPLINFTATFSFAVCRSCEFQCGKPGLAQMAQLDDAMHNPEKYDYSPKNNITAAYKARWTHSFNTANPAADVKRLFLDFYEEAFPAVPVYIAEYHLVGANQNEDLQQILAYAESSPLLLGISFFQYQVAYTKSGVEQAYGIFGLNDEVVASMPYFSQTYDIFCLQPNGDLPAAVAEVYGGPGVDFAALCGPNPNAVQLNQAGFAKVASQLSVPQMSQFVRRVISHMGASVKAGADTQLRSLAERYSTNTSFNGNFAQLAGYIGSRPDWIEFDTQARCVADRSAHPSVVGSAIGWVCSQEATVCENVPMECNASTYRLGDYIFGRYLSRHGDLSDPLTSCTFGGAALYAPAELYGAWADGGACIMEASITAVETTASETSKYSEPASTGATSTLSTFATEVSSTSAESRVATSSAASTAAPSATSTSAVDPSRSTRFLDVSTSATSTSATSTSSEAPTPSEFSGAAADALGWATCLLGLLPATLAALG